MKKIHSLKEGLEYKDMVGLIKPTIFVDEFKSKVGEDDAYVVLSFYLRNHNAAKDLVNWFESGYEWVIDADCSPGEIKPNRYLVFVEVKRRSQLIEQMQELIEDLGTLDDHTLEDWTISYEDQEYPFEEEVLRNVLCLSPHDYREKHDVELNEWRVAAGLPIKPIYSSTDDDINHFRTIAGLPVKK